METLAFGFYKLEDKIEFENIIKNIVEAEIVYNYKDYNIVAEEVIDLLISEHSLITFGVLNFKNEDRLLECKPFIWEISDYANSLFDKTGKVEPYPKLFQIIDLINKSVINKFILVFADEVDEKLGVRIENINLKSLKDKLCDFNVWEEVYYSLKHNYHYLNIHHPLVLIVSRD